MTTTNSEVANFYGIFLGSVNARKLALRASKKYGKNLLSEIVNKTNGQFLDGLCIKDRFSSVWFPLTNKLVIDSVYTADSLVIKC